MSGRNTRTLKISPRILAEQHAHSNHTRSEGRLKPLFFEYERHGGPPDWRPANLMAPRQNSTAPRRNRTSLHQNLAAEEEDDGPGEDIVVDGGPGEEAERSMSAEAIRAVRAEDEGAAARRAAQELEPPLMNATLRQLEQERMERRQGRAEAEARVRRLALAEDQAIRSARVTVGPAEEPNAQTAPEAPTAEERIQQIQDEIMEHYGEDVFRYENIWDLDDPVTLNNPRIPLNNRRSIYDRGDLVEYFGNGTNIDPENPDRTNLGVHDIEGIPEHLRGLLQELELARSMANRGGRRLKKRKLKKKMKKVTKKSLHKKRKSVKAKLHKKKHSVKAKIRRKRKSRKYH